MKKLWVLLMLCASVQAYAKEPCLYDSIQTTIRNAEYVSDVDGLRNRKDEMNKDYACQSPFQLAILRGKYSLLYHLIQFGLDINKSVPMEGFDPYGEYPDKIPAILFAALHASNGEIIQVLIDAGADPKVKDANGNDFFWYLERNPALRRTYLSDGGFKYLVPGGDVVDEEGVLVETDKPSLRIVPADDDAKTPAKPVAATTESPADEEQPEVPEVPLDDEMPLPTELTVDPADAMGE